MLGFSLGHGESVRADDDEAGSGDVGTAHGEGAHRGHVAGEEVLAAGLQRPRVALVDLLNARIARGDGREGGGRRQEREWWGAGLNDGHLGASASSGMRVGRFRGRVDAPRIRRR